MNVVVPRTIGRCPSNLEQTRREEQRKKQRNTSKCKKRMKSGEKMGAKERVYIIEKHVQVRGVVM